MDEPPTPPATLPDDLVEAVDSCSPSTLEALATYAESLAAYRAASREAEGPADEDTGTEPSRADTVDRPDGVPAKASTTVKEINGNRYYYWQWRDGDRVRSQYAGPVEDGSES